MEQLELFPEEGKSVLAEAEELIFGQREQDYGHPRGNFADIAGLWNIFLERRPPGPLSPSDVCAMMALLKMARLARTPGHRDSLVDAIGYLALAERCQ